MSHVFGFSNYLEKKKKILYTADPDFSARKTLSNQQFKELETENQIMVRSRIKKLTTNALNRKGKKVRSGAFAFALPSNLSKNFHITQRL